MSKQKSYTTIYTSTIEYDPVTGARYVLKPLPPTNNKNGTRPQDFDNVTLIKKLPYWTKHK